jgi:competence protein ComEC
MRLPGTLFSYICGLLAAPYLLLPTTLPFLIFATIGIWALSRRGRLTTVSLVLLFFCIGLFQYKISISPPQDNSSIHLLSQNSPVVLEGIIDSIWSRFPTGANCIVSITASFADGLKTTRSGNLKLTIDQLDEPLFPGEIIRFQTKLRAPRSFGTPGEFNYPRHLANKRIFTTGFIRNSSDIVRFNRTALLTPALHLKRLRLRVGEIINASVPEHIAPFLRGLAIGDRGALSPQQREQLAHSGLAHLFAISGLHLGIISSFLYILFLSGYKRCSLLLQISPPRRVLPLIILPVVAAYMIFTGGAISTLRALLVLAAVTATFCLRRQVAPLQLLAAAAFTMLLLDPLVIFTPAFQLSFAGAAGILCIIPRWSVFCQNRPKILTYPATLFIVTLAATLTTLPLILFHFHIFAPAGIILNLIAVPAVTLLAVPICLTGVGVAVFSPQTAAFIFNLAATVLDRILDLSSAVLDLPGFSAQYLYLTNPTLISISIIILALLVPSKLKLRISILAIGVILLCSVQLYNPSTNSLNLVAISVGQGEAALVTTAAGKTFLIDGGGFPRSKFDTGARLVAPTLGYLGIHEIDVVVLTHNHPDHLNGLLHILQHFVVRSFWSGPDPAHLPEPLKEILAEQKIPVRTFSENWSTVRQSENSKVAVFRVPDRPESRNDRSLVLYFKHGNDGLLLTGDLETAGIKALALNPPPGPVTLLKIPHHGSRYSNPRPLIELLNPPKAYISVGFNNRYKQPHSDILALLDNRSIQLERTDLSGSLNYESDGRFWQTRRWERGLFR